MPDKNDRLQASHDRRKQFETLAYFAGGGAMIAAVYLYLAGAVMPPPAPCLPSSENCVRTVDWGASICKRLLDGWPLLLAATGALASWTGLTLARGHMDARLPQNQGDQPQ